RVRIGRQRGHASIWANATRSTASLTLRPIVFLRRVYTAHPERYPPTGSAPVTQATGPLPGASPHHPGKATATPELNSWERSHASAPGRKERTGTRYRWFH